MIDRMERLAGYRADGAFVTPAAVTPEQLVLERYVFLPFVRSGIAATITEPFAWGMPARATVRVAIQVDPPPPPGSPDPTHATQTLVVRGPSDVTAIDAAQVVRTYPPAGKHDHDSLDLAHVELDRPDLPWLFTPAAPDAQGHLMPWIALVVAERSRATWQPPAVAGGLPVLSVARSELPEPDDLWAWAHAQVLGAREDPAHPVADRLSERNPAVNVARLLSPRRLAPGTAYVAAVVPVFEPGRLAGLGLPVPRDARLAPAWSTDGDPDARVDLPAYHGFEFATGEAGNFESLARLLRGVPAPPAVGRRRLDAGHPGEPVEDLAPGTPGAEQIVVGPVVSVNQPDPETAAQEWPSDPWPATSTEQLVGRLNDPDTQQRGTADVAPADPVVAPPLYGATHIAAAHLEHGAPPQWFDELNTDPRHRVVAGLGTRVVQMDQEALMASAWAQVQGVEAANRALRLAQLARYVATSLHRRHVAPLAPGDLLALTARVHSRVVDPGAGDGAATVRANVEASALPVAAASGAFRRLARARGPLARHAGVVVGRALADADGTGRDWVRVRQVPDGVLAVRPDVAAAVPAEVVQRVQAFDAAATSAADVLTDWSATLSGTRAPSDAIDDEALARVAAQDPGRLAAAVAGGAVATVLAAMPDLAAVEGDRATAVTAATTAVRLQAAVRAGLGMHVAEHRVDADDARRLGLSDEPLPDGTAIVPFDRLAELAERVLSLAHQLEVGEDELVPAFAQTEALHAAAGQARELAGDALVGVVKRLARPYVRPGGVTDAPRARLAVGSLGLVDALAPARTVTARIRGRLRTRPAWLRPDWFDDLRVQPIMVGPRFPFPMYEALHRYDTEWMIPGLAKIPGTDTVSLLETNNVFVEAFLVGLNHEMERELLWRGYPTDQRGTPFRSFWTRADELRQEVHAFADGGLGSHVDPRLGGRLVLLVRGELVRRYPGLVAQAARHVALGPAPALVPRFADPAARPDFWAPALFQAPLPPNLLLVGFDVTPAQMRPLKGEWWFTLSENPGEPRFGLDPAAGLQDGRARDDLTWSEVETPRGFLDPAVLHAAPAVEAAWRRGAAGIAWTLYQLPARAAFPATAMWPDP